MQSRKSTMLLFRLVLPLERALYTRYFQVNARETPVGFNAWVGSSAAIVGRRSQHNCYFCIPNQGEFEKETLYHVGQLSVP